MNGLVTDQLISEQQDRLEREFTVAEVEEVFEGRTEEVDDHCIIVAFCSEPSDERHANTASECLEDLRLILELGVFGFHGFELNSNLFARNDVDAKVDVTYEKRH